jgi:hypothetical protein
MWGVELRGELDFFTVLEVFNRDLKPVPTGARVGEDLWCRGKGSENILETLAPEAVEEGANGHHLFFGIVAHVVDIDVVVEGSHGSEVQREEGAANYDIRIERYK